MDVSSGRLIHPSPCLVSPALARQKRNPDREDDEDLCLPADSSTLFEMSDELRGSAAGDFQVRYGARAVSLNLKPETTLRLNPDLTGRKL